MALSGQARVCPLSGAKRASNAQIEFPFLRLGLLIGWCHRRALDRSRQRRRQAPHAERRLATGATSRCRRPLASHVRPLHMSWSKEGGRSGPRGYHHGNLKEALTRAALELIAQKGPAGFTFAEAARWAGVSPAAPYRHFRDRDELLIDVARR